MSTATHCLPTPSRQSGAWTLAQGHAVTLRPRQDGELLILGGSVWATLDGPHAGVESGPRGDLHLETGARLHLPSGRRVVLEPVSTRSAHRLPCPAATFDWIPRLPTSAAESWQVTVSQPAHELGRAIKETRHALRQLVWGMLTWVGGRLVSRRETPIVCNAGVLEASSHFNE